MWDAWQGVSFRQQLAFPWTPGTKTQSQEACVKDRRASGRGVSRQLSPLSNTLGKERWNVPEEQWFKWRRSVVTMFSLIWCWTGSIRASSGEPGRNWGCVYFVKLTPLGRCSMGRGSSSVVEKCTLELLTPHHSLSMFSGHWLLKSSEPPLLKWEESYLLCNQ